MDMSFQLSSGHPMDKGGKEMRKFLYKIIVLSLVIFAPVSAMAEVDVRVNISIPLPPPIFFPAPPELVVIPETYVYVVPDADIDIFFYSGWWWRSWEGRWYRSRHYDAGWVYYRRIPSFYSRVPSDWRRDYRERRWRGNPWDQHRIPHHDVEQNWRGWQRNKHWEKQNTWGVQGLKHRQPPPGPANKQQLQPRKPQPPSEVRQSPERRQPPDVRRPERQERREQGGIQQRKERPRPGETKDRDRHERGPDERRDRR